MPRPRRSVALTDADLFEPTKARPVRVRSRTLPVDAHFEPHRHAWAQVAYCASGMLQVSAADAGSASGEVTYIIPPSRAVWIAPSALHSVHVLEAAQFRTLYVDASVAPKNWDGCRVLVVSPLLRELVSALDEASLPRAREALLTALLLLARGIPVNQVALASGYASVSAFTAMFKAAMGQPPSRFQPRAA